MASSVLSRYLNPEVLSRVADRPVEPRGLVMGNLAGAHKSPLAGFAVEFAGQREYVWGDDPKHIDWRLYFTRDKYFIKQYEMETNFVCHLLLDVSASMRYGENAEQKLIYAAQLATTLGYSIIRQNDKVSLGTFDDRIRGFVAPSNSMAQVHRMTEHLGEIEPIEKTNMADCLMELAGRTQRREIIMVFSDFFTDLAALVRGCVDGYRSAYAARPFILDTADVPIAIDGAPDLVAQMLDKLVANAAEFGVADRPIVVRVERAGDAALLSVSNDGPLLPDGMRERLFESMVSVRADASRDGATPHLGLGLYIVRLVVERHRGTVRADNRADGSGVVVTVTLPLPPG